MSRNRSNNSSVRWLRLPAGFALCFATVVLLLLSRVHAAPQQDSLAGTSAASENRGVSGIAAAPAFSAQDLTAPPAQNWLKVGGSLLNQNWSPLKQIDRLFAFSNIRQDGPQGFLIPCEQRIFVRIVNAESLPQWFLRGGRSFGRDEEYSEVKSATRGPGMPRS